MLGANRRRTETDQKMRRRWSPAVRMWRLQASSRCITRRVGSTTHCDCGAPHRRRRRRLGRGLVAAKPERLLDYKAGLRAEMQGVWGAGVPKCLVAEAKKLKAEYPEGNEREGAGQTASRKRAGMCASRGVGTLRLYILPAHDQKLSAKARLSLPRPPAPQTPAQTARTPLSMIFSWLIRCVPPCSSSGTLSPRRSRSSSLRPQINNILFGPLALPLVDTDRPP